MSTPLAAPPRQLSFAQLEALWIFAGGNPVHAAQAASVAMAESGGWTSGPNATNVNQGGSAPGSTDVGLWQINNFYHPAQATYDPLQNAKGAIIISNNGQNWRPWCSAWSNNDCTGTFWGQGSNALAHFEANQGLAPSSQATLTSVVTSTSGGDISGGTAGGEQGDGNTCAWQINFPVAGSTCIASKTMFRGAAGIGLLLVATGLVVIGVAVIAVFGFGQTVGGTVGKVVTATAKAVPKA